MGLDTRYIPTKYFQEIFLDKTTGCPLSGGVVKFYKDQSRLEAKNVYILAGTAPNYSYVSIGNKVDLGASGTFEYANTDVTIYLFPYDTDGKIELYYSDVEDSGGGPQITREAFPNVTQEAEEEAVFVNYVPNGQFITHNDIVADEDGGIEAGEITDDITIIAPGGWTFERTPGSSAKDFVLFERIGSFVATPSGSPRYKGIIKNESPSGTDTFKHLALTFRDVNKFASADKKFTFAFEAKSDSGASQIEVKLIKNFGTGGSPEDITELQTINLTSSFLFYDIPFVFGTNEAFTIGPNNDDFVQLVITYPVDSAFVNEFDNVILALGDVQIDSFPDTTDAKFLSDSLAGLIPVPDYEGKNLYLPIINGPGGFEYYMGILGNYIHKSDEALSKGELWADGAKYRVNAYSDDKIPYRRLYDVWAAASDIGLSLYGTGDDEMRYVKESQLDQQFITSDTDKDISNDSWQSFTPAVTGHLEKIEITLAASTPPVNTKISIITGEGTTGTVLSIETGLNLVAGANTIFIGSRPLLTTGQKYSIRVENAGTLLWRTNAAGGYVGGSFNGTAEDALFKTYMIVSPAAYLLKANTAGAVVAATDGSVPTGFTFTAVQPDPYIVKITAVVATSITAGSYIVYHTTDARKYIVWVEKDATGTKPTETADVYIKVAILTGESASQVNNKFALAINGYSIRVPDVRGRFLSGFDRQIGNDLNTIIRTDRGDGRINNALGTYQADEVMPHDHLPKNPGASFIVTKAGAAVLGSGSPDQYGFDLETGDGDGYQTTPKNISANIAIKY